MVLGSNKHCEIHGIGIVRINMFDGIERVSQDVRYVHGLKRNLVSLGTLMSRDIHIRP